MSIIDPTRIKAMVEARLATVSATVVPVVLYPGMPVPDNVDRWCRLMAVDLTTIENDREDATEATGTDYAAVSVLVSCFASAATMQASSGALHNVLAAVRAVLHRCTLTHDATTHQIDLFSATVAAERDTDYGGQRRTATGTVLASGIAFRLSGATMMQTI